MSKTCKFTQLIWFTQIVILFICMNFPQSLCALDYVKGVKIATENFERKELGKEWHINTGSWKIQSGVLSANEIKADKHSAAARFLKPHQNAVYDLRFKFVGNGKIFHLGLDPAKGELNKKGHLYSVIIKRDGSWLIQKSVNKANREAEPAVTLAHGKFKVKEGQWQSLKVANLEEHVMAVIDEESTLETKDPSFKVKKPTVIFRCIGEGVEMDDLEIHEIK